MNNKLLLDLEMYLYSFDVDINIKERVSDTLGNRLSVTLWKQNKTSDRIRLSLKRKKCDKIGKRLMKDLKKVLSDKYKYDVYFHGTSIWESDDYTKTGFLEIIIR